MHVESCSALKYVVGNSLTNRFETIACASIFHTTPDTKQSISANRNCVIDNLNVNLVIISIGKSSLNSSGLSKLNVSHTKLAFKL